MWSDHSKEKRSKVKSKTYRGQMTIEICLFLSLIVIVFNFTQSKHMKKLEKHIDSKEIKKIHL
jgi:hypothetical protein